MISPAIYEERKEKYSIRIEAMKEYALSDRQCRSRILLRYFGERNTLPCQQCDNCRNQRNTPFPETVYCAYLDMLTDLLSDGQPHLVEELHTIPIPLEHLRMFLDRAVLEEAVVLRDGMMALNP